MESNTQLDAAHIMGNVKYEERMLFIFCAIDSGYNDLTKVRIDNKNMDSFDLRQRKLQRRVAITVWYYLSSRNASENTF